MTDSSDKEAIPSEFHPFALLDASSYCSCISRLATSAIAEGTNILTCLDSASILIQKISSFLSQTRDLC